MQGRQNKLSICPQLGLLLTIYAKQTQSSPQEQRMTECFINHFASSYSNVNGA